MRWSGSRERSLKIVELLRSQAALYRGSLVRYRRRCGARGCKCARGELHEGWVLSFSTKGKTHAIYVTGGQRAEIEKGLRRYGVVVELLQRRVGEDIARLRENSRRYKKRA